jgi:hypothetical protein
MLPKTKTTKSQEGGGEEEEKGKAGGEEEKEEVRQPFFSPSFSAPPVQWAFLGGGTMSSCPCVIVLGTSD